MQKLKKRSYIDEHEHIDIRIIFALVESKKALSAYHIAKKINESTSLTSYHLLQLLKKKIIIAQKNKRYRLQKPFYQLEEYITYLFPLIKKISEDAPEATEETTKNILSYLFYLYSIS